MACTRSRLRIWVNRLQTSLLILSVVWPTALWAAVASQFSLLLGEQYSDNIFFSKEKEDDFVSIITPTLTLLYAPSGQIAPTLTLNISSSGEIYGRHSELNNFGDNINVNGGYTYQYSPRVNFHVSNRFRRQGATRLAESGGSGEFETGQTSPPPVGGVSSPSPSDRLENFISRGNQLTNSFNLHGRYLYRPDLTITAGYTNRLAKFLDAGGTDVFHTIGTRAVYNWRRDHNLHAGYSISILDSRTTKSSVIHNLDFGDDYFTNYNLQLTPTLSLTTSTGLSLNLGSEGPRVANNTRITFTKLWETADWNVGVFKGLTPSFGVAGVSDTTSFFSNFNLRLTDRLSTQANANFSLFDTEDVNFKVLQAGAGAQYLLTSWLSSNLNYYFNWSDSGAGATGSDLLNPGSVRSNVVFLSVTLLFDLWPNIGLARGMSSSATTPRIRTPFPSASPTPVISP